MSRWLWEAQVRPKTVNWNPPFYHVEMRVEGDTLEQAILAGLVMLRKGRPGVEYRDIHMTPIKEDLCQTSD